MDFKKYEKEFQKIKEWLLGEFSSIRTGAASVAILDKVKVDAYGSQMPLNQVASISIENAKTLVISPFDKGIMKDIEKGIEVANLGLSAVVSSDVVRLNFPDLTVERREMLLKLAKDKLEEARIRVRRERDEVWKEIQQREKDGEMTEDEKFRLKDGMEDKTKEFYSELDEMYKRKEEEINL